MSRRKRLQTKRILRREHFILQSGRCFYCDSQIDFEASTLDRIIPGARGGQYTHENTVMACAPCNQSRGDYPADIWLVLTKTGGITEKKDEDQ